MTYWIYPASIELPEMRGAAHLQARYQETVLHTLLRHGVDLEYQCGEGFCGSCRLRVLQGQIHCDVRPLAYLEPTEFLACCSYPVTLLCIEIR